MKINKKLFFGTAGILVPIVPIATSISMSMNTDNGTTADFINFNNRVNDKTISHPSQELLNRFFQSDTFKGEHDWDKMNYEQLHAAVVSIYKLPATFTLDEKVSLAKYTIQENMYQLLFKSVGLSDTRVTQAQILMATGNLKNPFESNASTTVDYIQNGQTIPLKGATGHNIDFAVANPGAQMYNVSNQTILEFLVGTIAMSPEVTDLVAWTRTIRNDIEDGTTSLLDAFKTYQTKVNAILSKYSTQETTADELVRTSILNIFDIPQLTSFTSVSAPDNNDALYEVVIKGGIGEHLFKSQAVSTLEAYKAETDLTEKQRLQGDIFARIGTVLRGFTIHDKIDAMNNVVDFSKSPNVYFDNEFKLPVEKLAALLVKYSNDFHNDVEMKIVGDYKLGHSLWIKSGHDATTSWTKVPETALQGWAAEMDLSSLWEKYHYQDLSQVNNNPGGGGGIIQKSDIGVVLASPANTLQADQKPVVWADGARHYWIRMMIKFGNDQFITLDPTAYVYENDDDHDSDVKFADWTASTQGLLRFTSADRSKLENIEVRLEFADSPTDSTDQFTTFSQLAAQLKTQLLAQFDSLKATVDKMHNNQDIVGLPYDKTAAHDFFLDLHSIHTDILKFNTYDDNGYDDTHSDYFRFSGVNANITTNITETRN